MFLVGPDRLRYEPMAKIVIRSKFASGDPDYARMTWEVDSVSNYSCCGVGRRRTVGKNSHCIGDAERKAATTPTTGCYPADRLG